MKGLPNNTALEVFTLGDRRLNKRLGIICEQLNGAVGMSTPQTISDSGQIKAYYRFINNKKVKASKLIDGYGLYSRAAASESKVILAIQDTTTLNYTGKKAADSLDCLESITDKGFMLHNHLLINDLGCPIGLFSQTFFGRKAETLGKDKKTRRKKMPFIEKESYRWLREFEALQAAYKDATDQCIIQICDREADIHEVLQARTCEHIHYLIRSSYERADAEKDKDSIWQQVADMPFMYEYTLQIPEGRKQAARTATMQVRYKCVTIRASYRKEGSLKPQVIWILETKEVSPMPKDTEPIHWRLLTSLPILSPETAAQIIQYYIFRWLIERFHFVLKQGLLTESLQIEDPKALQNAIVLKSWQAIDVMILAYAPKTAPETRLSDVGFTTEDYNLAYSYAKKQCNTKEKRQTQPLLIHFVRLIAQIGGHSLQINKPIGIVTIWRGWNTFSILKTMVQTIKIPMDDSNQMEIDIGK